jgi:hypothetical protein
MELYIREAGWGIWPVFLFSLLSLGVSIYYLLKPKRGILPLVIGLSITTLIAGCLGALTGVQHSVQYIEKAAEGERWMFLVGLRESLNNLVVALIVVFFVSLFAMVGAFRQSKKDKAQ